MNISADKELWGDLGDDEINQVINEITEKVNRWDNIHAFVFVFVKYNTGFAGAIFHPTSRRETTKGEYGKPGVYLRNGTVVDSSLLSNVAALKRGKLNKTISGAFNDISELLFQVEQWKAIDYEDNYQDKDYGLDNINDWLPVVPSRSVVLPNNTFEYLQNLSTELDNNELREKIWEVVRNQIRISKSFDKKRILDALTSALNASTVKQISLLSFLNQLNDLSKEMREFYMKEMSEKITELYVYLDKIDYTYSELDGFQVPANCSQGRNSQDKVRINRSKISIIDFSNSV